MERQMRVKIRKIGTSVIDDLEAVPIGLIYSVFFNGENMNITMLRDSSGDDDVLTCIPASKPTSDFDESKFNETCEIIVNAFTE